MTPSGLAVKIRPARLPDSPRLAELLTQLGYPATEQLVSERLGYWLPEPTSEVLVAERDGQVIGSISLHAIPYFERTGRCLRIDSLVVDQHARGTGAGRALMRAASDLGREWGCVAVEVTSSRSRPGAHAFYRSLGFVDVCDRSARFFKMLS